VLKRLPVRIWIAVILVLAAVVALLAGGIISRGILSAPTTGGDEHAFVTRSGSSLLLDGRPFRFVGANIHWLALDDSTNYPSQFRVNDALDAAREMGVTLIRAYSLGISAGCPACIEPAPGHFNQTALQHVDYVVKAASERGMRVIIPLTDGGQNPTGGIHTFTDWRGISDAQQFYTNPKVIRDFETYIRTLLKHVNVYTGVANADDPAIFAWETGNGLQPLTSWTQTISTYIKSIDKHHLVIDGNVGIDPNAARLRNVDILSDHFYPKNIASMFADAQAAQEAGKAFIVAEFDWNDADGGDPLSDFLASAQSDPAVAGVAFWELWSHDDQYGFSGSNEQSILYYPGTSSAMSRAVQLLRAHAFAMRNQAAPPVGVPGTPLLETVIRNGPGNQVIWRGTALAASYTVETSTAGPAGPWSVICQRCATDADTPWVDAREPIGPLWYRVTAYNLAGVASPPSPSYQAGSAAMLIDNMHSWSGVYQHSANLTFDTTSAQLMGGDISRAVRTNATHQFIIWKHAHTSSFQAIGYFWPGEPVSSFTFSVSADGKSWRTVVPGVISFPSNWLEFVYSLQGLTDVAYVKIAWNNVSGQPWNPNLGTVSIL
jgi:Cellulase (glycosyl hydrolase family 5)